MVAVKYDELEEALQFVSTGTSMDHEAVISLDTGQIFFIADSIDEELPEDIETSDRYISVPHKNDLDLGRVLVLRFVEDVLPDDYATVEGILRRRGAYGRFKDLLASKGCLEKWYQFEADSTRTALKDWCAENGIELSFEPERPVI